MEQQWRETLYYYVDECNRCRVDPAAEPCRSALADPGELMERGRRSRLLADWYAERGIAPVRGETGVRVLRWSRQTPGEVLAEVELHSVFYYEKGGMRHQEERLERERLTLVSEDGGWRIAGVERYLPERKPLRRTPAADWRGPSGAGLTEPAEAAAAAVANANGSRPAYGEETGAALSPPLLNRRLLGGGGGPRATAYRREEAAAYADRWWKEGNPDFETFEVDCTNYVSQCLFAGGAPINYTGKRETGWWYKGYTGGREWWSYSWAVSDSLGRYLAGDGSGGPRAELVERPEQLALGDIILYDWDGNGHFQHSTVVTAFDAGGMPLVNAHTVSSRHRYWDYRDSYAWTDRTAYRFFHINDYL